jgi:hypothetical protein
MTTESPPQKEAAPRSRKAATAKTDALQKSHITSQIQLPKALAKLGITATDPSGRPPLRGMAAKEWRRWKSANLNIVTFVEHDLGNCSLLTITSRRSTEKLFRKRLKNFWDRRLREHVTARITVLELHKNGSPHAQPTAPNVSNRQRGDPATSTSHRSRAKLWTRQMLFSHC